MEAAADDRIRYVVPAFQHLLPDAAMAVSGVGSRKAVTVLRGELRA